MASFFFGYGSLVNKNTHTYKPTYPANLGGYRRAWRYAAERNACFLTIEPDEDCTIDGLIAPVTPDWAALDLREAAYDRFVCTPFVSHDGPGNLSVSAYAVPNPQTEAPKGARPILLSYLDTVVQGFLHHFGAEGVERFAQTTIGWDIPVVDDRRAPVYPRAQNLSAAEKALADDLLARKDCTILSLEAWSTQKSDA